MKPKNDKFDCSKYIDKCGHMCCGTVPMPKKLFRKFQSRKTCEVVQLADFGRMCIPLTKDNVCPFMAKGKGCVVYEHRPSVCRNYGNESDILLTCPMQDASGRERPQEEIKEIMAKIGQKISGMVNHNQNGAGNKPSNDEGVRRDAAGNKANDTKLAANEPTIAEPTKLSEQPKQSEQPKEDSPTIPQ